MARRPCRAVALVLVVIGVAVVGAIAPPGLDVLASARWVPAADAAAVQAAPTDHEGEIFSFGITVPADPITVGDRITFPNNSDRPHTITDRGNTFDSGEIAPGTSGTVTFDTPGRVEIFCQINPSTMNALVVVDPGDEPPLRSRVQLYDEFREGETRRFDPAELKVDAGTALTVANVGGLEHTFTAEDGSFNSGTVTPGAEQGQFVGTSATVQLEEAGSFEVFCELFPDEMRGTLEVVADEPEATTTTAAEEAPATTVAGEEPEEDVPPDGEAAEGALIPGEDDGTDAGAIAAAVVVVLLGLGAIALALAGRGPEKDPPLEAF